MALSGGFAVLGAAWSAPAGAAWLSITDFAGACGTKLVCAGAAAEHGSALRLVPPTYEQAGAAWAKKPYFAGSDFTSTFTFRLGEGANGWRADGLAFVLATSPVGLGDPERYGGSMGFEGLGGTVAVEFDTFDNGEDAGDNHVALARDGVLANLAAANPYGVLGCSAAGTPGCLSNGDLWTAVVTYNAGTHALSVQVRDGDGTLETVISDYAVNLGEALGEYFYMGFSAGTGGGFMAHDLLSWTVGDQPVSANQEVGVPEPAGALLLAMGLAGLGLSRRRG